MLDLDLDLDRQTRKRKIKGNKKSPPVKMGLGDLITL